MYSLSPHHFDESRQHQQQTPQTFSSPRVEATFRYHFRKSLQQQKSGSEHLLTPSSLNDETNNNKHEYPHTNQYSSSTSSQLTPPYNSRNNNYSLSASLSPSFPQANNNNNNKNNNNALNRSPVRHHDEFAPRNNHKHHHQYAFEDNNTNYNNNNNSEQASSSSSAAIYNNIDDRVKREFTGNLGLKIKSLGVMNSFYVDELDAVDEAKMSVMHVNRHQSKSSLISHIRNGEKTIVEAFFWNLKLLCSEREVMAQKYMQKKMKLFEMEMER